MAIDPNIKILIVDDHSSMVAVIRTLLKQIDLSTTDEASDGTAALVRLREQDFDLVISDCDMEPMGGLELLTEIRGDTRLKDIPVVHRQPVRRGRAQGPVRRHFRDIVRFLAANDRRRAVRAEKDIRSVIFTWARRGEKC
jgi:chemotaxis response regulator CheB